MVSNSQSSKIAYVVPTKDRREDLVKLLSSLEKQTNSPEQIVIVDGGDDTVEDLCAQHSNLPIRYVRVYPPSLSKQRNAGMAALNDDITIAGYLDDDLELAENATEEIRRFWDRCDESVGGVAFAINNQPQRQAFWALFSNFFLNNGTKEGRVLKSGFSTSIGPVKEDLPAEWLYGGATLWRRKTIDEFDYDEWYIGHGYLEDLDYSYRVSRKYKLWVSAAARVWHWPHPVLPNRNLGLGRQQVLNRVYFFRKMGSFSKIALAWALFGQLFLNLLQSAKSLDRSGIYRAQGNLQGLVLLLKGFTGSDGEIWK